MFDKILIANRGEIACRIIKTARRMGVRTVAVFSEADAGARHVRLADEAVCIGPAAARESYLVGDKIIAAARQTGAKAIHPGYGFLSENEGFRRACDEAGIVFIGPPARRHPRHGLEIGSQSADGARPACRSPPAITATIRTPKTVVSEADSHRLSGADQGGGRRRRQGHAARRASEDFLATWPRASARRRRAFGDDRVLIERYLTRPRHVEIQVFGDSHGNCVSLFERDCSVQRRHQKVLEEAPAPGMSDERRRDGRGGVRAARAVGYVGAGTVNSSSTTTAASISWR